MNKKTIRMGSMCLALTSTLAFSACDEDEASSGTPAVAPGTGGTPAKDPGTPAPVSRKDIVDTAVGAGSFKTLAAALTAADLVTTLKGAGPFTVFAPTDAAFAKLPAGTVDFLLKPESKPKLQGILKYHVVAGSVTSADVVKLMKATTVEGSDVKIKVDGAKVFINDAQVTMVDIQASNGVIHVIDTVLLPKEAPTKNIVEIAAGDPIFSTLVAAVTAADLAATLKGTGPFTVFAPTNAAFAKLPAGTVDTLLKPENKAMLQAVLKYHVVPAKVLAADVVKLTNATTVQGKDVSIKVEADKVLLNGNSTVIKTDIEATNGVIHIIDTVLLPPM